MPCFLFTHDFVAGNATIPFLVGALIILAHSISLIRRKTLEISIQGQRRTELFAYLVTDSERRRVLIVYFSVLFFFYIVCLYLLQNVIISAQTSLSGSFYEEILTHVVNECGLKPEDAKRILVWYWPAFLAIGIIGAGFAFSFMSLDKLFSKLNIKLPKLDVFKYAQYQVGVLGKYNRLIDLFYGCNPLPICVDQESRPVDFDNRFRRLSVLLDLLNKETINRNDAKLPAVKVPSYYDSSLNRCNLLQEVFQNKTTKSKAETDGTSQSELFHILEKDTIRLTALFFARGLSEDSAKKLIIDRRQLNLDVVNKPTDDYEVIAGIITYVIIISVFFTFIPTLAFYFFTDLKSIASDYFPKRLSDASYFFIYFCILHSSAILGAWLYRVQYHRDSWFKTVFKRLSSGEQVHELQLPIGPKYLLAVGFGYAATFLALLATVSLLSWRQVFDTSTMQMEELVITSACASLLSIPTSVFFIVNFDLAELGKKTPQSMTILAVAQFLVTILVSAAYGILYFENTIYVKDGIRNSVDPMQHLDYIAYVFVFAFIVGLISGVLVRNRDTSSIEYA